MRIQLDQLAKRLAERRIELVLSDAAAVHLASAGFDPVYGARPLKRAVQKEVLNPLAQALLKGDVVDGQRLTVDYQDGRMTFAPSTTTPV